MNNHASLQKVFLIISRETKEADGWESLPSHPRMNVDLLSIDLNGLFLNTVYVMCTMLGSIFLFVRASRQAR